MKAMILAAGIGQRMRPLTEFIPKPLLRIQGQPLIDYHLHKLAKAGFSDVLINHAYLGQQIVNHCGDGSRYGLTICYSDEGSPLETGGAINRALDFFDNSPFALINGDTYSDFDFGNLRPLALPCKTSAHLIMVDNPDFHPEGDFALDALGRLRETGVKLTYSGIAVIHPRLISAFPARRDNFPLGEAFRHGISNDEVSGQHYQGLWSDVGTPRRLIDLVKQLRR